MQDLKGKTAFITGGASGIGLALAEALGAQGMNVCISDIESDALTAAVASLKAKGLIAEGLLVDVTKRTSLQAAARACLAQFGKVHLLVNSAGVMVTAAFGELTPEEWNWLIDVNIKGVVNGVETFVPLMLEHGEGGHVVNIASIAGFQAAPGLEAYSATKAAVIAMSEAWRTQLAGTGVSASVVCPGHTRTNIATSRRNRGDEYGGAQSETALAWSQSKLDSGMAPEIVAARIVEGVKADELHIFTHTDFRQQVEARLDDILAAFDRVDVSPVLLEEANA